MEDKKLTVTPLALFSLCAVLVVDTLTASASLGVSSLGWWALILLVFVIPYGLITSELSAAFPGEGGIYDWVKRAFGPSWAIRTTWFYWINVGLWMPAVYILFAGMFSELFYPNMPLLYQVIICIALTWLTVLVSNISVDIGVLITNFCAVLKVLIILTLGIGGFIYAAKNGVANEINLPAMLPSIDIGVAFLPALVFNLMGFELVATMTKEMKDPTQIPKVLLLAIGATAFLYIIGTLGILMALPIESIGLVSGIIDTFKILFGDGVFGHLAVNILGTVTIITLVGNMVSWTMGSSRAAAESANDGELPEFVGKLSKKYGTPVGASTITGTVSTIVILLYAFLANSNDELFWTMFSFSGCIFLLPYLFMFPAYLKLKVSDTTIRPFKVPGNLLFQTIITMVCFITILQALILFIFPSVIFGTVDWHYSLPILIGVSATVLIGELLLYRVNRNNKLTVLRGKQ